MEKKTYSTVDLFKLLAAVLVVFIHANTTKTDDFFNMFNYSFALMAVPFFFLVSGFFFYKGLNSATNQFKYLLNYVKKLLLLYGCWLLVSIPFSLHIYLGLYNGRSVLYIILILIRRWFLCGEGVFWYILVMAESACVIYFATRKKRILPVLVLIVVGLILGVFYDNKGMFNSSFINYINKGFYYVFSWSNNFIMKGIPFMGIGFLLAHYHQRFTINNQKLLLMGLLSVSALSVLLYYLRFPFVGLFIIQAVLCFLLSVSIKTNIPKRMSLVLREISSSIYFLHTFLLYYVIELIWGRKLFIPIKVLFALTLSLLAYWTIKLITKKKVIKPLCFMFNINH